MQLVDTLSVTVTATDARHIVDKLSLRYE